MDQATQMWRNVLPHKARMRTTPLG